MMLGRTAPVKAVRSRDTQIWICSRAVDGGHSSHTASTSLSTETTRFASSARTARITRARRPCNGTLRPSTLMSSGPRIRRSILSLRWSPTTPKPTDLLDFSIAASTRSPPCELQRGNVGTMVTRRIPTELHVLVGVQTELSSSSMLMDRGPNRLDDPLVPHSARLWAYGDARRRWNCCPLVDRARCQRACAADGRPLREGGCRREPDLACTAVGHGRFDRL